MIIYKNVVDTVEKIYAQLPTKAPEGFASNYSKERATWIANTEMCLLGTNAEGEICDIVHIEKEWSDYGCDGSLTVSAESLDKCMYEIYDKGLIPSYILRINKESYHGLDYLGGIPQTLYELRIKDKQMVIIYFQKEWFISTTHPESHFSKIDPLTITIKE